MRSNISSVVLRLLLGGALLLFVLYGISQRKQVNTTPPPTNNRPTITISRQKDNSPLGSIWVEQSTIRFSTTEDKLNEYLRQYVPTWEKQTFTVEYEPTMGTIMEQAVTIEDDQFLAGLWVYLNDQVAPQVFRNTYVFHLTNFKVQQ